MAAKRTMSLRGVCSKIHLWVGLAIGVLALLISVTGSALVFRVELDRLMNPAMLRVDPGPADASLEEVATAAAQAVPSDHPRLIRFPRSPEAPYEVWLTDNTHVYVHPGTAEVLGVRGYEEGLMNGLFALHTNLFAGAAGEFTVGVVGILLLLLAATGVVLWWPALSVRWRRLRAGLIIALRHGPWRLNYDLHRTGGFYSALFLVLVSLTGCGLVFSAELGAFINVMTRSKNVAPPPVVTGGRLPPQPYALLDDGLDTARRELPDAVATFLTIPLTPETPLAVRMRTPAELHPNGRSYVYMHPRTGKVLRTDDQRAAPMGPRILHLAYPLHIGAVGNIVARWVYVLLGLAPALLSVTGTLIWYRRWRKQNGRFQGDAPPARTDTQPGAPIRTYTTWPEAPAGGES